MVVEVEKHKVGTETATKNRANPSVSQCSSTALELSPSLPLSIISVDRTFKQPPLIGANIYIHLI